MRAYSCSLYRRAFGLRKVLSRHFTSSRCHLDTEEYEGVQEMMDANYTPPANYTEKRDYTIPRSLISSWRQQRRLGGSGQPSTRFKDVAMVKLCSGDGGDGKISFLRDAGRSVGPPDGGDGGSGGHVLIQATPNITSLKHIRHIYKAQSGRGGGSAQLNGKRGENIILQVPVGTQARWAPDVTELRQHEESKDVSTSVDVVTNLSRFDGDVSIQLERPSFKDGDGGWLFKEQEEEKWVVHPAFRRTVNKVRQFDFINRRQERQQDIFPFKGIDLDTPGEPVMLLKGGTGGLGNMHFQMPDLRSPSFAKKGRAGAEITLMLELRLLADLALVGLPNAGKSTLLRSISRARPEVGDYAFTTLVPSLGTINMGIDGTRFSVADIPGIIKDAHLDKGLGLGFLRHVERCRGLVFVIGLDRADPVADLELLLSELGPERLTDKNVLVIASKADVEDSHDRYSRLEDFATQKNWRIIPASAIQGNVEGVVRKMAETAAKL